MLFRSGYQAKNTLEVPAKLTLVLSRSDVWMSDAACHGACAGASCLLPYALKKSSAAATRSLKSCLPIAVRNSCLPTHDDNVGRPIVRTLVSVV